MVVATFLLDISELSSLLYVYDAIAYQWNFLEGHLEWYDILLIYNMFTRGDIPPWHAFHTFHLLPTHGAPSLTPLLLFIHPRTNQRP